MSPSRPTAAARLRENFEMTVAEDIASLQEIRDLLKVLPQADEEAAQDALLRQSQLTKPAGSLGRLEELAVWLATWQGRNPPSIDRPYTAVFAGNHGIAHKGVSAYPRSEEHTSELQSLMRISYAVFCLKKKNKQKNSIIKK